MSAKVARFWSAVDKFVEKLFWTLASAPGLGGRMDGIPFLNGGLFDDDEFAQTPVRKKNNPPLLVRNETFAAVFDELLEAFNFTVREDTPLDQDVAVDPEMLGKVFESIVLHAEAADPDAVAPDKRKATGSYYTPRIVVHFICREVLYQYLRRHLAGSNWDRRLRGLLEMDATNGLNSESLKHLRTLLTPEEGKAIRDLLASLKCCDPAVGSGAFPVGLLHELVNLRRLAETAANGYVDPVRKDGHSWLHAAKEQIVQDCLFGVDLQQQAIEICRLRLWLSLVVDYDLGIDPFNAQRDQFKSAIGKISQLPNLEMNFRRGDSLLDLISDVPVRIGFSARGLDPAEVEEIQKLQSQLHHASKAEKKKTLRIKILRKRLDLTERVLNKQLESLQNLSVEQEELFGKALPDREKQRRRTKQIGDVQKALARVQASRKELDKLVDQSFDVAGFYPKLRRLEGADFDSPFNFAWPLDFAPIFSRESPGFDIMVGNPPFVTARIPAKRDLYRDRWPLVCVGNYLLLNPFFELSLQLLRPSGQLGFIVSNAFARRDLGKPLIEKLFPTVNLQKILDCSGLLFPGHGTPTCLVFVSQDAPAPANPVRVAGILPGGGDLRTPPEESHLWKTIEDQHDAPGYADKFIIVSDRSRESMHKHPWYFDNRGGGTQSLLETNAQHRFSEYTSNTIGRDASTQCDDLFYIPDHLQRRMKVETKYLKPLIIGELIRNWHFIEGFHALWPYDSSGTAELSKAAKAFLAPFEAVLKKRSQFNKTILEAGLEWFEYREYYRRGLKTPQLVYAYIATHFHAAVCDNKTTMNRHALLFTPRPGFSRENLLLAVALLNASAPLFWLKQVCFNKGAGEDEERDRYELAGGKVEELPVPNDIASAFSGIDGDLSRRLLAHSIATSTDVRQMPSLNLKKVLEKKAEAFHSWNTSLSGYVTPHPMIGSPFSSADELQSNVKRVIDLRDSLRAKMIARQEEMDWLVYAAYGLIEAPAITLADADLSLAREHRPFCLWAAADGDFAKAGDLIPSDWSEPRKQLWRQRLEIIRDNENIRRIEQPVYKRRWDEQWKVGNRWVCGQPAYDAEFLDAFDWWLSEKAEWWLAHTHKGKPVKRDDWAAALWSDPRVQAAWTVAAETTQRLTLWRRDQTDRPKGKPPKLDASHAAFTKAFKTLVNDQSVPENIPYAVPWEDLEKKKVKVPTAVKSLRGKLNVPRERFRTTPDGLFRVAGL